jgi:hypothetical protein
MFSGFEDETWECKKRTSPLCVHFMHFVKEAQSVWWIGYGLNRKGQGLSVFATASRSAQGSIIKPPIQWVSGYFSLVVKRPGYEADHSPPPSTEVIHPPSMSWLSNGCVFMTQYLVTHRDNLADAVFHCESSQNRVSVHGRSKHLATFPQQDAETHVKHLLWYRLSCFHVFVGCFPHFFTSSIRTGFFWWWQRTISISSSQFPPYDTSLRLTVVNVHSAFLRGGV